MKKVLLMLFACGLMTLSTFAQVSTSTFSQATNTFDTLASPVKTLTPSTTATGNYYVDSTAIAGSTTVATGIGLPIGFTFKYNGTNYDLFGVNADGWISFGQSSLSPNHVDMTSTTVVSPISTASSAPAVLQDRVSAFGLALCGQATSRLSYATIGTAPNRTLVVEWKKFRKSTTVTGDNISFQIRLSETTNLVKVVYGTVTYSGISNGTAQVGLRGSANTDYNNRTSSTSWTTTTAGTANTSTINVNPIIYPATGLTFTWTPFFIPVNDAGITVVNSPVSPIATGNSNVNVTIKNFGTDSLKDATIGWSVNGVVQTSSPFSSSGLPKDSVNIVSIGTYNFTVAGNNIIKAWTSAPNGQTDENPANDTVTKTVFVQGYATLPFAESFNGTWINSMSTRDVPSIYWANTPSTGNSSWRRSNDGAAAAWNSASSGAYTPAGVGIGTLLSARFHSRSATAGTTGSLDAYINFSPVGTKELKFWHINTSGTDTLSVMFSNDGGTTFNLIQKIATSTAWTQHSIILGTSTATNCIVRFQVKNLTSGTGMTDVGIDSVQVDILTMNDAGLTAINAPTTPVAQGSDPVTVTIKNYGANNLTSATINWTVNGVAQTPFTFANTGLVTGATSGPDTIGNYNFTSTGFYTIKAWVSMPNGVADENHTNDTVSKIVYVQSYAALPFMETFENPWIDKNDTSDVPSLYWSNTPAFGENSWRRDDDTLTAPWTEGNSGTYTPGGANNTSHSARFHTWYAPSNSKGIMDLFLNFTPAGGKILDFWYINTDGTDSLAIYLSTDNGATFGLIQKLQTATVWTENLINIGNSSSPNCILRFKATSDYGQTDLGIDQVHVFLQPNNDISAYQWVSPVSGCGHTNAESVTVKVINTGLVAQSNIPVIYSIDAGNTIIGPEMIPGPVNPGDTATYTFNTTADFSNPGLYQCGFVVQNPGDALPSNDTAVISITSIASINSFPFIENFNTGSSNYFVLSANANADAYYDTIGTQNTYGIRFTGKTTAAWTSGTTSAVSAWANTTHQATAVTCGVDATSLSKLYMKFDLLETTSNSTNFTYTWYAVVANGTDTLVDSNGDKFFNPSSANDVYASKVFDLTNLASTSFSLKFVSACRRDAANSTNQIGDNVFFDNLALYVPPVINDLGPDTSICQGTTITLDAGAGIGYTYVWTELTSGDVIGTDQTLTVDTTGTYNVVVTNSYGFSVSDHITVTVVPAPVAFAGNDTIILYQTYATLYGSEMTGTGPFIYTWTPANLLVNPSVQNPTTVSLNQSAIFNLYITDTITGCQGTDQVVVYVNGGPLTVQVSASPNTLCPGECTSLMALPSGGSGNYTYSWTSVPVGFSATIANPTVCPIETTTYTVTVDDGSGTATASIDVIVQPVPVVSLGNDTILCKDANITLDAGSGTGFTYLWSSGQTSQTIVVDSTYASSGIATVAVTVTNSNGCSATGTITITFVPCVGINENGGNNFISLYPNPTTGTTNIVMNGFSNAVLNIYNVQGTTVYSENIATGNAKFSKQYDFSYLPKGLYLIRISNESVNKISKLIIQ